MMKIILGFDISIANEPMKNSKKEFPKDLIHLMKKLENDEVS